MPEYEANAIRYDDMMCGTHNIMCKIYHVSAALLLVFISLFVLSCKRQHDDKRYLIGVINLNPTMASMVEGFKEGLTEKGYVDGRNVSWLLLPLHWRKHKVQSGEPASRSSRYPLTRSGAALWKARYTRKRIQQALRSAKA